ncbi:MAG: LamG domain-containing protein, partial [Deltaproteobacteria bacterium]|nr:LamG domain-containing protein [Deltaproteobacteria bacterium]
GSKALDSSGSGNIASLVNTPTWTAGKIGGAVALNGVNNYVDIASSSALGVTTAYTISLWVKPSALVDYSPLIFRADTLDDIEVYDTAETGAQGLTIVHNRGNGGTFFFASNNRGSGTTGAWGGLPKNKWNHLVITYANNTWKLYLDGVQKGNTITGVPAPLHTNKGWMIGRTRNSAFSGTQYLNGLIDDVRIYNRALSATEVEAIYTSAPPPSFDFTIANGGSRSVTQGLSISNSITASLAYGTPQAVSFVTSGLPQGSNHTLSSPGCNPTCSVNLTVNTSISTPAGIYKITITGAGGEMRKTTSFTLIVDPASVESPSVASPLPPGSLQIPLTIKESIPGGVNGVSRVAEPVTVGIPLEEKSGVTSVNQLGLSGAEAGQFRVLARWPNGNIKWVLVDFQADVPAGGTNSRVSLTTGSGNFGGSLLATDDGPTIAVYTGPAQFVIRKSNFNIFDSVVVNGQALVKPGNSGRMVMRDTSDREYTSANDLGSTALIEENGPVRTVVKAIGSFRDSSGRRLADYTLRLHFFRGKSYVKAFVVLRNADSTYRGDVLFNSVEAVVPIALEGAQTVELARKSGAVSQKLGAGEIASIFQGFSTGMFGPENRDCFNWTPPVAGSCDPNFNYTFDPGAAGLEVKVGSTVINSLGNQDDWTQGWAELRDDQGKGVTLLYRWMSGYWPAGLEISGDGGTSIELFSKRNPKKGLNLVFQKHEFREIMWDFHTQRINNAETLYHLQYPLVAYAELSHYQKTKALYGQTELVTAPQQNSWFAAQGKTGPSLYPWYRIYRMWGWGTGGGANQTDFPLNDLLDFLRTGYGPSYLIGEQRSLFNNTAIVHSDDGNVASASDPDPARRSSLNGGFIDMEHAHVLSLPFYYFLSGNEWIKEGLLNYGQYLDYTEQVGYFKMPSNPYSRAWSRKYRNVALIYEFTCQTGICDSRYKDYLANWTDFLLNSRDNPPNFSVRGRNLNRGYLYWDSPWAQELGFRPVHALTSVQIHFESIWQALRIMNDTAWNYPRKEDIEDYLTGVSQFVFNEYYDEIGSQIEQFGFMYGYPLDKAYTIGSAWYLKPTPYDASRAAVFGYQRTGDTSFLTKANKLIWAITEYATARSPSELQDQALMYAHFNPPKTWKPVSVSVQSSGNGSYTLTWTVPQDAGQYQIKYADQPIVEWLGFDKVNRTYRYDPAQYAAYFAAANISDEPGPAAPGTQQQFTVTGLDPNKNWNFAMKYHPDTPATVPSPPKATTPAAPTGLVVK